MADVLSQNEIDSLLSVMGTGGMDVDNVIGGTTIGGTDAVNYDFRRPNRISKNQVRMLQNVMRILPKRSVTILFQNCKRLFR